MVLSRIWSAFIIVAILVASIKYLFSDNYKAIYNDMVVGKSGDTVQIASKKMSDLNPEIQNQLLAKPDFDQNRVHYKTDSAKSEVQIYRVQETDGVIGTSETAVKICLGLIGIMTLFMGFMSIAEMIHDTFALGRRKFFADKEITPLSTEKFTGSRDQQLKLF